MIEKMHFMGSFRLNCLQKVLELDIDDKWILDEASIQWGNLTILNNTLNEIRFAFLDAKSMNRRKKKVSDDAKTMIKELRDFRKYVASYLDSLK